MASASWFVCSVTLPSETEDKKCQLREVLNASNQDYGTSVCGPATYVVDQTPSLTQVPSCIVFIPCESSTTVFVEFFVMDHKIKEVS